MVIGMIVEKGWMDATPTGKLNSPALTTQLRANGGSFLSIKRSVAKVPALPLYDLSDKYILYRKGGAHACVKVKLVMRNGRF